MELDFKDFSGSERRTENWNANLEKSWSLDENPNGDSSRRALQSRPLFSIKQISVSFKRAELISPH